MKPRSGSASEFVLKTLSEHADRELRLADLDELAAGRFQKENIGLSLKALLEHGLVVKIKDGAAAWWAIAAAALAPEPAPATRASIKRPQRDKVVKSQVPDKTQKSTVPAPVAVELVAAEPAKPVAEAPVAAKPAKKVAAKPAKPTAPTTPVSETDAVKAFVLEKLQAAGRPMTLLELLDQRQRGDKHVSMRTLKLATYYLTHDLKIAQEELDGQTRWASI